MVLIIHLMENQYQVLNLGAQQLYSKIFIYLFIFTNIFKSLTNCVYSRSLQAFFVYYCSAIAFVQYLKRFLKLVNSITFNPDNHHFVGPNNTKLYKINVSKLHL